MSKPVRISREESQRATRTRLIEAAQQAFAQHGFGGASIDRIAELAGFSKGAFYSNFESKEAIFLHLLSQHMAAEIEQLSAIVTNDLAIADILSQIDSWLAHMNADADWSLLAMELQLHAQRSPAFAKKYLELQSQHRALLGGLIERIFVQSHKQPPAPPAQLAGALMALAHGLALQRTEQSGGSDPAGGLIKTILRSLIAAANNAG